MRIAVFTNCYDTNIVTAKPVYYTKKTTGVGVWVLTE